MEKLSTISKYAEVQPGMQNKIGSGKTHNQSTRHARVMIAVVYFIYGKWAYYWEIGFLPPSQKRITYHYMKG